MSFQRALRLERLPPYLFIEIDQRKKTAVAAGKDVINLGVGDPDRPTPGFIIDAMQRAIRDPKNHRYPYDDGAPEFKRQASEWFARRFGVRLDPTSEILSLIGTKEGLGHLPLACVNPEDLVLVPSPGYPVYQSSTIFAGGRPHTLPLHESNGWLPDLDAVSADVWSRTRLLFLNYPNNPTGAAASASFFDRCVGLARSHGFLIAHDAAYSEIWFETPPPSILQAEGARDCCVEFHSLSKTFNMTGWRLGFVAGQRDVLAALAKVKGNVDSGQFGAIQAAGAVALAGIDCPEVAEIRKTYRRRRDCLVAGLRETGFRVTPPAATFYVFAACPPGQDSMRCVTRMLDEASVVAIPGVGFGPQGEGYVRFALCAEDSRIVEAVDRLRRVCW